MNRLLDGVHILIVEDDEDNRELLSFALRDSGAKVTTARSAAEVRALLETALPDLIVSDLSLPGEDGCAMMASLRANPATAKVPAIALTGYTESSYLVRAVKAGFAQLITKPVDLPDLLGPIASLVGRGLPTRGRA